MTYIDGYLTPVRADKRDAFRAFSAKLAPIYKEYSALRVVDCWGEEDAQASSSFHAEGARDALEDDGQTLREFGNAANATSDEIVVLSWTEWPDKATRDAGLAGALADPRIQPQDGEEIVFDGRRLIAGGFTMILDV